MATASGQVTNAVFGFTSMFINVLKEQRPDEVLVAFDRPEPTFRHEADATYKANREAAPDILRQQMGLVREVLDALGVATCELAGWEADDLIATATEQAVDRGDDVVIVTGDRDAYQLVSDPHVKVLYNRRGVSDYALYDEAGHLRAHRRHARAVPRVRGAARRPERQPARRPGRGGEDGGQADQQLRRARRHLRPRRRADAEAAGVARRARGAGAQEPRDDVLRRDAPIEHRRRVADDDAEHGRGQAAVRLPRVPHVRRPAGRGARPGGGDRAPDRRARARSRPRSPSATRRPRRRDCWRRTAAVDVAAGVGRRARPRRRCCGLAVVTDAASAEVDVDPRRPPRRRAASPPRSASASRARPRRQAADALAARRAASMPGGSSSTRRSPPTCSTRRRPATSCATCSSATPASLRRSDDPAADGPARPRRPDRSSAPTRAGREALAVHHLVEPITTGARRRRAWPSCTHDREPARARARPDGARRRSPSTSPSCARCNARLTAEVQRLGGELQRGRRARRPQHQLADPAPRDPLRPAARRPRADAGQEDQDRRLDRRGDAREAARPVAGVHRPAAAVPRGREAARHVRRGPARRGRRRRPDPRHVQPDRRPHRPAQLGPPEPAQHPGAPRGGPAVPQGVRRRRPAASCWSPTTTRSSCAASPTSPPTRA